jgi:hypothetical protein
MMLFVVLILELVVGGDLIDISNAVPRRNGTIGVNSNATSGSCVNEEALESPSEEVKESFALECAADISKASINPGETTIEHSSG